MPYFLPILTYTSDLHVTQDVKPVKITSFIWIKQQFFPNGFDFKNLYKYQLYIKDEIKSVYLSLDTNLG